MEFKAFKMDGLGNDFVIIDRRKNSISIVKEKIVELGKRDNIGFDQLIFLDETDPQAPNYIPITIYNSDGEEVEACGNGSRCVAKLICDEKKIEHAAVLAGNRVLKAQKISKNSEGVIVEISNEGKKSKLEADVVLISVGRKPYTDNLNLENISQSSGHEWTPKFSPDGKKIVYSYYDISSDNYDIYLYYIEGKNRINHTNRLGYEINPQFSPDGSYIVYQSWQKGVKEIFFMNIL